MKHNKIHISIAIVLAGMTSHTVKITRGRIWLECQHVAIIKIIAIIEILNVDSSISL